VCGYSPEGESVGGNALARYCYSVWLRHLVNIRRGGFAGPMRTVAELGPGDSLGTGIAALLSGADEYYGLDVVSYLRSGGNLLDEIAELYARRVDIPDEFPDLHPKLDTCRFPAEYLTPDDMARNLAPDRLSQIRRALGEMGTRHGKILVQYWVPWSDPAVVQEGSVDVAFSQAVMEHVEEIELTYEALWRWLRPGGMMSHQIDFRSHGLATVWNGHWTYSNWLFRVAKGRRPYLINRHPKSAHSNSVRAQRFEIVYELPIAGESGITRDELDRGFRHLSEQDMSTCGLFILCRKPFA
jgi:hypothetical protein